MRKREKVKKAEMRGNMGGSSNKGKMKSVALYNPCFLTSVLCGLNQMYFSFERRKIPPRWDPETIVPDSCFQKALLIFIFIPRQMGSRSVVVESVIGC